MKEVIKKELDFEGKIIFPEHHESHAAPAFSPSPFQKAAFLTIDGVGKDNEAQIQAEINFPHSLGLFFLRLPITLVSKSIQANTS